MKGVSSSTIIDYLYYPENNDNQIIYRGYKDTDLFYENRTWRARFRIPYKTTKVSTLTLYDKHLEYLAGRREWVIPDLEESEFREMDKSPINITLSSCLIEEEFTCQNGLCIPIKQRCNKMKECQDKSDELDCNIYKLRDNYHKETPPSSGHDNQGISFLKLGATFEILSVENIDLDRNKIEILYSLKFSWIENRLSYFNAEVWQPLHSSAVSELWSPFSALQHKSAVFGTVGVERQFQTLQANVQDNPITINPRSSFEDFEYPGRIGTLHQQLRLKALYDCHYDLFRFPFDQQKCKINLELQNGINYVLRIGPDNINVSVNGIRQLNEFEIIKWYPFTEERSDAMSFGFTIEFYHLYSKQIITLYFQQYFLWIVSYLTIYIDINDFGNRFMGTVTALLVLSTLIDNMNTRLPARANVRLIDIWNIFYILQIILIIVFHILLNSLLHCKLTKQRQKSIWKTLKPRSLNQIGKYLFLIFNTAFTMIYFWKNYSYQE